MRTVLIDLKGKDHCIGFELTPNELSGIGEITVQWSYLEHVIYDYSVGISEVVEIEPPADVTSHSFTKRLRAWRLLIEQYAPPLEKDRLLRIVSKIANLEQDRHRVTHGIWGFDESAPEKLIASSRRPPFDFTKKFEEKALFEVARKIGEVTFQLLYPNGEKDFYAEQMGGGETFGAISRRLLLEMSKPSKGK